MFEVLVFILNVGEMDGCKAFSSSNIWFSQKDLQKCKGCFLLAVVQGGRNYKAVKVKSDLWSLQALNDLLLMQLTPDCCMIWYYRV